MAAPRVVYRGLLRASKQAFKGDDRTLTKSREEIRGKFLESAGEQDAGRIKQLCAEGEEAASFLKTFVVQGKLNERGNYAVKVEGHHADATAEEAALR